jgi:alkylated DNA nucleotide flippase Atl1
VESQKKEMEKIPWHRVVDRNCHISVIKLGEKGHLQKMLLEKEGIEINDFRVVGIWERWMRNIN